MWFAYARHAAAEADEHASACHREGDALVTARSSISPTRLTGFGGGGRILRTRMIVGAAFEGRYLRRARLREGADPGRPVRAPGCRLRQQLRRPRLFRRREHRCGDCANTATAGG